MTKRERLEPEIFQKEPSRIKRVAKGCGREDKDVVDLLQRFMFMRKMMGDIGQQAGMLQRIPGMKQAAMARRLNDMVKTGGLDHNPMMAGLADQLLEAAVAGDPAAAMAQLAGGGMPTAGVRKTGDKAKKRKQRKDQRKARKRSRKK